MAQKDTYQVVIVGGGTAGITVAAQLSRSDTPPEIAIIEPSEKHYYQPQWTLVGAGVFPREISERDTKDLIPPGVIWIKDRVVRFDPGNNNLITETGKTVGYHYLIVAAGIQLDWDKIPGLKESLGKNGVCSNYSYHTVNSTWESIRNFKGGNAIFTQPNTPIKCGGAPQKICYLAEHYFRKTGVRDKSTVTLALPQGVIFAVKKYANALVEVAKRKGIDVKYQHNLVELRSDKKEAIFKKVEIGESVTMKYDMIHVTPPMSAPDCVKNSPLASEIGWVDVNKDTLQHNRFDNIFGIGDCSSLPTSKTAAAIRKQAPVLVRNLLAKINGTPLMDSYDGYTACPVVTGYGSVILAEFDYKLNPRETFPFDQSQERYSMYALKAFILPRLYWHGMLKGRA
ncbi:MAG: NAD(P)/FAD-dependent oxidoreductase [Planctomycetia bacterium]|nr:MAG: NAD(P)/FAD-dependent oxidoreductase [Planctomycetia bacterium]TVL96155.1 MAG: pyridine nucleotide-disulfide oxidoreductase [Candidatus Brocadia sp. BL1]HQU31021.1 FAD/NAD(P)-binding oxidoreductase [Candidatus Brocadia sapporoensis]